MYPLNSAKMSLSEPVISYNIARQRRERKGQCHGPHFCGIKCNLFQNINILSYWAIGVSVVCNRLHCWHPTLTLPDFSKQGRDQSVFCFWTSRVDTPSIDGDAKTPPRQRKELNTLLVAGFMLLFAHGQVATIFFLEYHLALPLSVENAVFCEQEREAQRHLDSHISIWVCGRCLSLFPSVIMFRDSVPGSASEV